MKGIDKYNASVEDLIGKGFNEVGRIYFRMNNREYPVTFFSNGKEIKVINHNGGENGVLCASAKQSGYYHDLLKTI